MHLRYELEKYYIRNDANPVRIETIQFDDAKSYIIKLINFFFGFLNICSDPEMIHINSSPEAPPPRIRILDTRSREVETVRIGDRLTFRIEIPEDSKFY